MAGHGGATARGGGGATGNAATAMQPNLEQKGAPTSYPRSLRTFRDDPELEGSPEVG